METTWWYIELCATLSCYCSKLLLKDSAAWRSTTLPHRHRQAWGGESSLHTNILQNQDTDNTNGQSTDLIQILTIVLQMSFSWIISQYLVAMSSYFLSIWDNPSVFLCFSWPWHFLRAPPVILYYVPQFELCDYFLSIKFILFIFGKNVREMICCPFLSESQELCMILICLISG